MTYDFAIIGGGIIGSAIARSLKGSVIIIDKEQELGKHASGRNSGVIHSGFNLKPRTLKAKFCVEGSKSLREYCTTHNIPVRECGTLVIARNEQEEETLEELRRRGRENGVPGLEILTRAQFQKHEQFVEGKAALRSPTGAVVDSLALLHRIAEENIAAGKYYFLGAKVQSIDDAIHTDHGIIEARHIVNCAGLYADKIAQMMGYGDGVRVIPFRGEYVEVKKDIVQSMVYQAPDLRYPFLSIHLTKEVDGKVLAGPSAVLSFGRESYAKEIDVRESLDMLMSKNFWAMALQGEFLKMAYRNLSTSFSRHAFLREIQSLTPLVVQQDLLPSRAGIRAQMVSRDGRMLDDMLVQYYPESTHVLNAVSPGMTCSLAFGEYVAQRIQK